MRMYIQDLGNHYKVKTTTHGVSERHADLMASYRMLGLWDIIRENKKDKPQDNKRHHQSVYRTRKKMVNIIELNLNDTSYFVTLTYKENMQDYDISAEHFKAFIRKINNERKKQNKEPIRYMATRELQQRGAIHYHMVVFDKISLHQVKRCWSHGTQLNVKHIKDIEAPKRIANYLTAYLIDNETKETNPIVSSGKKLLFYSRNIKQPIKETSDEVKKKVRKYIDAPHVKTSEQYRSKYEGYVDIYLIPKEHLQ